MTSTCGVDGITSIQPRMPSRWGTVCSGAMSRHFSKSASTCSLTSTGSVSHSPPLTMRWPTAPIWCISVRQPCSLSSRLSMSACVACAWVGIGISAVKSGLAGGVVRDFAVDADALTKPLGDDLPRVHIEKLILQRRAARVDYEYIHNENKLPFLLHGRRKHSGRLLFLTIRTETIILPLLRNCKSFSAVCGPEKRKRKIHKQTRRRACRPAVWQTKAKGGADRCARPPSSANTIPSTSGT